MTEPKVFVLCALIWGRQSARRPRPRDETFRSDTLECLNGFHPKNLARGNSGVCTCSFFGGICHAKHTPFFGVIGLWWTTSPRGQVDHLPGLEVHILLPSGLTRGGCLGLRRSRFVPIVICHCRSRERVQQPSSQSGL